MYSQEIYEQELAKLDEKFPTSNNHRAAIRAAKRIARNGMSDEEMFKNFLNKRMQRTIELDKAYRAEQAEREARAESQRGPYQNSRFSSF